MEGQKIVGLIRENKYDKALDELYQSFPTFKKSFVKSGGRAKDAEDIFQDALLIFIKKAKESNFELNCAASTYLYSICRNLSLVHFREISKAIKLPMDSQEFFHDPNEAESFIENEKKYDALDAVLNKIGKRCMELLKLFYSHNLRMHEIAKRMDFKSETSAKTQKYKCLEKAKQLANPILSKMEL